MIPLAKREQIAYAIILGRPMPALDTEEEREYAKEQTASIEALRKRGITPELGNDLDGLDHDGKPIESFYD